MNKTLKKLIHKYLLLSGLFINIFTIWLLNGTPFFIDRFLVKSDNPIYSDAIVCLCAGITKNNLPSDAGWERIYITVQLYFDKYATKIIFSGGGSAKISEAEVYAEAAHWLGCPKDAIICEPLSNNTAQHPNGILRNGDTKLGKASSLNIVTSSIHARRALLVFKKSSFSNIRLITTYHSKTTNPSINRALMISQIVPARPVLKKEDVFSRLLGRTCYFLESLRELVAIVWYKIKGYI